MKPSPQRFFLSTALLALAAVGSAPAYGQEDMAPTPMSHDAVEHMVADWPEPSRMAVMAAMEKYGTPDGVTPMMLMWMDTAPFKRTMVYRDPVQHDFPAPHPDVMEQVVDYRVPPEMFDELAMYDGSVIVERTKGEMSARCDMEPLNMLALNLAHEIVMNGMTVEQARTTYAEQAMAFKEGRPAPYTERLTFTTPMDDTMDPDHPPMMEQSKE